MNVRETNGVPRFGGQVALVVGAAHGIGKAIAVRLGREGAQLGTERRIAGRDRSQDRGNGIR